MKEACQFKKQKMQYNIEFYSQQREKKAAEEICGRSRKRQKTKINACTKSVI